MHDPVVLQQTAVRSVDMLLCSAPFRVCLPLFATLYVDGCSFLCISILYLP